MATAAGKAKPAIAHPGSVAKQRILVSYRNPASALVEVEDGDRLPFDTVAQLALACQQGQHVLEFQKQVCDKLEPRLGEWCAKEAQNIATAYLAFREGRFLFLVVRKAVAYDRDFSDRLTDLDIAVARDSDLDLIKLDVLALPNVSEEVARSFIGSGNNG